MKSLTDILQTLDDIDSDVALVRENLKQIQLPESVDPKQLSDTLEDLYTQAHGHLYPFAIVIDELVAIYKAQDPNSFSLDTDQLYKDQIYHEAANGKFREVAWKYFNLKLNQQRQDAINARTELKFVKWQEKVDMVTELFARADFKTPDFISRDKPMQYGHQVQWLVLNYHEQRKGMSQMQE